MKKSIHKRKAIKLGRLLDSSLNPHKWETKMEMRHLLAGTPDLKINTGPKGTQERTGKK